MQLFIFVLIFCFVIFLYRLYHLANDDYILLKKNIILEQVFNLAFISAASGLFFSRFFYVLFNPKTVFLNPLGFVLFPYFPGLSLSGCLVGGIIAILLYSRYRQIPIGRVFDFFVISLISVLPIGLIGYFLLSGSFTLGGGVSMVVYLIFFFFTNLYLFPRAGSLEMKAGTISILFFVLISIASLISASIDQPGLGSFVGHRENFLYLFLLLTSFVLLIRQEILGRIS